MRVVRGIYHRPGEQLERAVYARTAHTVQQQIKLKCGLRCQEWKDIVDYKADVLEFDISAKGIIDALNHGLSDGADYAQ
tara:strand:+ start:608 stop:844 length:237 start_codon:yes stop_codon:yes gene_type:complete